IGSEALALARPIQLYRILVRRLDIKHFGTVAEQRREVVHVAANAATPRMRNEHEDLLRKLGQATKIDAPREGSRRLVSGERQRFLRKRRIELGQHVLCSRRELFGFISAE